MTHSFSRDELKRYNRQLMLPEVGLPGQQKIKDAKVLVIGAGGLGSPISIYLANAGVGTLGLIDFDQVAVHNLHRQILFSVEDVGKNKAQIAGEKLKSINSFVDIRVFNEKLSLENAAAIIAQFDFIVDGSDNFSTRYLVNDTCVELGKPLVYGSILKNEGQLAVFNHQGSKNLRHLFPDPPNPEDVPSCDQNGVLGFVPGIIGVYMSGLVIQLILEQESLKNQLLLFNFKDHTQQVLAF